MKRGPKREKEQKRAGSAASRRVEIRVNRVKREQEQTASAPDDAGLSRDRQRVGQHETVHNGREGALHICPAVSRPAVSRPAIGRHRSNVGTASSSRPSTCRLHSVIHVLAFARHLRLGDAAPETALPFAFSFRLHSRRWRLLLVTGNQKENDVAPRFPILFYGN